MLEDAEAEAAFHAKQNRYNADPHNASWFDLTEEEKQVWRDKVKK
jgi:hypothetical protein